MRILIVHNRYLQPGGEDAVVETEARLLRARGHEVIRYEVHNDETEGLSKARIFRDSVWNREQVARIRLLVRGLRPDVMHVHNTFVRISPAVYWAAQESATSVVQTVHNYRLVCPNALMMRNERACEDCVGRRFAWPAVVHKCYRGSRSESAGIAAMLALHRAWRTWHTRVHRFVALTEFAKGRLVAGGLPKDRIDVKPNLVQPDPGMRDGTGRFALFVGRLSNEKGIDVLLRAWRTLSTRSPLRLIIAGDGPMSSAVRAECLRSPNITWLGYCESGRVSQLMGDASFLVFPSLWYEGMPRTIIEAFAHGLPVIGSRIGAMAEMINDGVSGFLVPPGDVALLAASAQRLAIPSVLEPMREAARNEYVAKYTAESNYAKLIEIYNSAEACRRNSARRSSNGQGVQSDAAASSVEEC